MRNAYKINFIFSKKKKGVIYTRKKKDVFVETKIQAGKRTGQSWSPLCE